MVELAGRPAISCAESVAYRESGLRNDGQAVALSKSIPERSHVKPKVYSWQAEIDVPSMCPSNLASEGGVWLGITVNQLAWTMGMISILSLCTTK